MKKLIIITEVFEEICFVIGDTETCRYSYSASMGGIVTVDNGFDIKFNPLNFNMFSYCYHVVIGANTVI